METFEKIIETYKCECKHRDEHGCTDCQNSGYIFDNAEISLIIDQHEKLEKLQATIDDLAKGISFYGDEKKWKHMTNPYDPTMVTNLRNPDTGKHSVLNLYMGGKTARALQAKYPKVFNGK